MLHPIQYNLSIGFSSQVLYFREGTKGVHEDILILANLTRDLTFAEKEGRDIFSLSK